MQQKSHRFNFVAVILKVLLVNLLAALNFSNVFKKKKRLENKKVKKRKERFFYIYDETSTTSSTHTRLTVLYPGLPGKPVPIWILLKQETVSGGGISWAVCKSASRSRQMTTPAPHHSVFTGRVPVLPPNQQHQSAEGTNSKKK